MIDHVYIIAEAGVNHNGKLDLALKLCDAAKEAGVDAIKFQTWKTENIVTKTAELASYQENNISDKKKTVKQKFSFWATFFLPNGKLKSADSFLFMYPRAGCHFVEAVCSKTALFRAVLIAFISAVEVYWEPAGYSRPSRD